MTMIVIIIAVMVPSRSSHYSKSSYYFSSSGLYFTIFLSHCALGGVERFFEKNSTSLFWAIGWLVMSLISARLALLNEQKPTEPTTKEGKKTMTTAPLCLYVVAKSVSFALALTFLLMLFLQTMLSPKNEGKWLAVLATIALLATISYLGESVFNSVFDNSQSMYLSILCCIIWMGTWLM